MTKSTSVAAAFYLAVLPAYRQRCIDILLANRPDVQLFCSTAHLDPSVRTGIRPEQYTIVRMTRIFGKMVLSCREKADAQENACVGTSVPSGGAAVRYSRHAPRNASSRPRHDQLHVSECEKCTSGDARQARLGRP